MLFRCLPFLFTSMSKLAMQSWCQQSSMQAYDKYVQIRKVPDWYWRMASNYRAGARPATALSFGFLFSSEVMKRCFCLFFFVFFLVHFQFI